jgi:hypothetical protein
VRRKKMNRKTAAWLGVGCGGACIVTIVATLIAGGAFFKWAMEEPENINIHVDVPIQAAKNDSLVIEVRVENTATESQSLDSIDVSTGYLEGIAIEGSEPSFTESFALPIIDQQSYTFEREIPPGETLIVEFSAIAVKAGDFGGEISVCVNTGGLCTDFVVRTVVE